MSEKEVRAAIERMCQTLDRQARAGARLGARGALMPIVFSAGLAATACGDDGTGGGGELYGAPGGYTTSSTGTGGAAGGSGGDGGSGAASTGGGGSGAASTGGGGAGGDAGGAMEYMAPDP